MHVEETQLSLLDSAWRGNTEQGSQASGADSAPSGKYEGMSLAEVLERKGTKDRNQIMFVAPRGNSPGTEVEA